MAPRLPTEPPPRGSPARPTRDAVRSTGGTPKSFFKAKPKREESIQIVPDSEEERTRDDPDIIEISSDSEDDERIPKPKRPLGDPALRVPGAWLGDSDVSPVKKSATPRAPVRTPATPTSSAKKSTPSKRPQLGGSATSTDVVEDQVAVLAAPVPQWLTPKPKVPTARFHGSGNNTPRTQSPDKSARRPPRVVEVVADSESEVEVLDNPVRISPSPKGTKSKEKPPTSKEKLQPLFEDCSDSDISDSSEEESIPEEAFARDVPNKYAKYWDPPTPRLSARRSLDKLKTTGNPLVTFEEHASRITYAEQVYSYLNKVVFKNGLPTLRKIELKWNNKLLSTAGRAQFHRDRNGNEFAEIHLASKVVDSDERIRNTLGHEMCHLACWMIDKEIKESHGPIFRKWARRVERKDANIEISIRHTYEISYPFRWECVNANCLEITGRFSISIDPAKNKCPLCKIGSLVPLFDPPEKKTKPDTELTKMSKHAPVKSQSASPSVTSSPRARPRPRSASIIVIDSSDEEEEIPSSVHIQEEIYMVPDSDSEEGNNDNDSEIADLARKFEQGVTISHKVCLHAAVRRAKRI
ncbi:SprT-like family-domain-containing protein [Mycena maculata]|uniref:SprT-like family-domain-containing protein n=1 Tax=Mycena maculata TaxID=230809 RepID=A0AAD7IQP7_9AGAR|nr:SprT-like family-domain-containing protein [Mycena maculata]